MENAGESAKAAENVSMAQGEMSDNQTSVPLVEIILFLQSLGQNSANKLLASGATTDTYGLPQLRQTAVVGPYELLPRDNNSELKQI